jgi:nucleotide-binding universal stress UspA family protein
MQHSNECRCRSILVPLDGSDVAEHALPTALSLARRHRAALHLVRVYVPVAAVYGAHALRYDETLDREFMAQARDYLDGVVTRLADVGGVRAGSALLGGMVADTISQHATALGADLIVMTTHGRGPLARFWLGSVSDELARRAGVPVLFVRPSAASPDLAGEPLLRRVLIPLDGSELAESILQPVLALGDPDQTEYTLLQVVMPAELSYGPAGGRVSGLQESLKQLREVDELEAKRARDYLEPLAQRLRERSTAVSTRVACNERPATAILDDASVHAPDLIALATHGRGGLKRLVLGSVADKVLRGAETAVLVYRPADDPAGGSR